jgi:FixJ family two-component response regulator
LREREKLVAVVDDDESVRTSLSRLLRAAGYVVAAFAGGGEFLQSAATPDCLLLDLDMPQMSGADVLGHLVKRGISFPTIVISGSVKVGSELPLGPNRSYSVLRKPFDDQALLDAVDAAIRRGESPADGT